MIVACMANYWLFIPAVIIVGVQLLFRWFFLHTSRHIKRLEALGNENLIIFSLIFSLQLAVHCILTSHPQYKAYLQYDHIKRKKSFITDFIHIKMNTLRDGTYMLPPIVGLA